MGYFLHVLDAQRLNVDPEQSDDFISDGQLAKVSLILASSSTKRNVAECIFVFHSVLFTPQISSWRDKKKRKKRVMRIGTQ